MNITKKMAASAAMAAALTVPIVTPTLSASAADGVSARPGCGKEILSYRVIKIKGKRDDVKWRNDSRCGLRLEIGPLRSEKVTHRRRLGIRRPGNTTRTRHRVNNLYAEVFQQGRYVGSLLVKLPREKRNGGKTLNARTTGSTWYHVPLSALK